MKKLFKAIIGVGTVYGLCRISFLSGIGAGAGANTKVVFDELGIPATADELKGKKRPRNLDETIMDAWYNATIESLYKEAGG